MQWHLINNYNSDLLYLESKVSLPCVEKPCIVYSISQTPPSLYAEGPLSKRALIYMLVWEARLARGPLTDNIKYYKGNTLFEYQHFFN